MITDNVVPFQPGSYAIDLERIEKQLSAARAIVDLCRVVSWPSVASEHDLEDESVSLALASAVDLLREAERGVINLENIADAALPELQSAEAA